MSDQGENSDRVNRAQEHSEKQAETVWSARRRGEWTIKEWREWKNSSNDGSCGSGRSTGSGDGMERARAGQRENLQRVAP